MKRILFVLLALVAFDISLFAQEYLDNGLGVKISDVEINASSGEATITVELANGTAAAIGTGIRTIQFDILLPEGIQLSSDDVNLDESDQERAFTAGCNAVDDKGQHLRFVGSTLINKDKFIKDGVLFTFNVKVVGTSFGVQEAKVTGDGSSPMIFSCSNSIYFYQNNFSFKINVPVLFLYDDKSYEAFPSYIGDITVKRTIGAGKWNTICLPFPMFTDDIIDAFGGNVTLAKFDGCVTHKNKSGEITGLGLRFSSVNPLEISANTPYLIKVTTDVPGFSVENTSLVYNTPVATGEGGSFVGTYKVIDPLGSKENPVLFISNNSFYTAIGKSKLNSFRGYFELDDLADYREAQENQANITLFIDDEATGIVGVTGGQANTDTVYDLQGRLVKTDGNLNNLQKGIYIVNGQKVTVK